MNMKVKLENMMEMMDYKMDLMENNGEKPVKDSTVDFEVNNEAMKDCKQGYGESSLVMHCKMDLQSQEKMLIKKK